MSRSKHSEAQIIAALKQVEAGRTADDVARECGVSKHTIYAWKAKFGGMDASEAQKLRALRSVPTRPATPIWTTELMGRKESCDFRAVQRKRAAASLRLRHTTKMPRPGRNALPLRAQRRFRRWLTHTRKWRLSSKRS